MSWANLPYDFEGLDKPRPKVHAPRPASKSKSYVEAEAAAFRKRMQDLADAEHQLSLARQTARTDRAITRGRQEIIREYLDRGLMVRYSTEGEPIALSTMISIGWRVVPNGMGGHVLEPPEPIGAVRDRHAGEGQRT